MPEYEYEPIDPATDTIRLALPVKGYFTDPIRCGILKASLYKDQLVSYEALSCA
jgi:hypothetical protein